MPDLADVIEFLDEAGDVLAIRLAGDRQGGIRWGSQLIVREGQVALLFRDGKSMAAFPPGRHTLTTQNFPILGTLSGLPFGGETPFRAEVTYVGSQLFRDLRWGTPEPVYIPDPVLVQIPVRANGRFAIRVTEPAVFVPKVVGTRSVFRVGDLEDFLRAQYIVPALTDATASLAKPFSELPRYYRELGLGVKSLLGDEFAALGLELSELSVSSVSTTEEIQQSLTGMSQIASEGFARGKATEYDLRAKAAGAAALREAGTSYQQAGMTDAMKTMAENAGSLEGGGPLQQGVNLGLMMSVPQMMSDLTRGGQAAPPVPGPDPAARLKQLKELLDMGAISAAEFEAKKAEILKLL